MSAIESRARLVIAAIAIILGSVLSGCASTSPRDPLEPFNRGVYAFNDAVDTVVLKPIATGYVTVLPQFMRTGVSNFFSNLDDITVVVNSLLQAKIPQALSDTGRFVINSTLGLLGFVDVATHLGLEKHNEDFGQTLGYWGVGNGPYLMLPLLGPSTFRDGIGRWADYYTDVVARLDHIRSRNVLLFTRTVSHRAQLLDSEKVLDAAAIDRYAFIRDAYLQRRRSLVHDGNPPPDPEEDEPPAKPRGDKPKPQSRAPEAPTILTDSFGNVVAAPLDASAVPAADGRTGASPVLPQPAAKSVKDAAVPPEPTPAASTDRRSSAPATSIRVDSPARVTRVWLPGGVSP